MSQKRVLIVDDAALMRTLLQSTVLGIDPTIHIDFAEDGSLGLAALAAQAEKGSKYNLIFLDWNMPVMTGKELLIEMRKDKHNDSSWVVVVTAEAGLDFKEEGTKNGADYLIAKPFDPEKITVLIKSLLNKERK